MGIYGHPIYTISGMIGILILPHYKKGGIPFRNPPFYQLLIGFWRFSLGWLFYRFFRFECRLLLCFWFFLGCRLFLAVLPQFAGGGRGWFNYLGGE